MSFVFFYYLRRLIIQLKIRNNEQVMTYFLIVLAIVLSIIGLVGAVVPGIAGTPFSFLGLLALSFVDSITYSATFLVIMALIGAVVFALDYVVPVWGTKKFGGTKSGVRGSTIGLFLGLFITFIFPIGFIVVLLGPFVGAYIGEKMAGTEDHLAWKSAFGSFVGFLLGTGIKLVYASFCIYFIFRDIFGLL